MFLWAPDGFVGNNKVVSHVLLVFMVLSWYFSFSSHFSWFILVMFFVLFLVSQKELHYNVSVRLEIESDSARHVIQRKGPGGLKHIEIRCFAIQQWI